MSTGESIYDLGEELARHASAAYESVRALNHATLAATMPAPTVYDVLGSLTELGRALAQLTGQVSRGLERSLTEYSVYDDARDPAVSVAMASEALAAASCAANDFWERTAAAQGAIAWQGYRLTDDNTATADRAADSTEDQS